MKPFSNFLFKYSNPLKKFQKHLWIHYYPRTLDIAYRTAVHLTTFTLNLSNFINNASWPLDFNVFQRVTKQYFIIIQIVDQRFNEIRSTVLKLTEFEENESAKMHRLMLSKNFLLWNYNKSYFDEERKKENISPIFCDFCTNCIEWKSNGLCTTYTFRKRKSRLS